MIHIENLVRKNNKSVKNHLWQLKIVIKKCFQYPAKIEKQKQKIHDKTNSSNNITRSKNELHLKQLFFDFCTIRFDSNCLNRKEVLVFYRVICPCVLHLTQNLMHTLLGIFCLFISNLKVQSIKFNIKKRIFLITPVM